jgi:electron transport complex protein RnfG
MNEAPKRGGYIGQAWLVILLALLYGGALAGVETSLRQRIIDNKMDETYDRIPDLVAGADRDKTRQVNQDQSVFVSGIIDGRQQRVYRAIAADGKQVGWVVPARGQGFADRIELLIGLDPQVSTITGLFVLDQKETPGLGNFITDDELFLNQFAGMSADDPLVVRKTDPTPGSNQIRALSGATISSESVATIVNKAIENLKEPILQLPGIADETTSSFNPKPEAMAGAVAGLLTEPHASTAGLPSTRPAVGGPRRGRQTRAEPAIASGFGLNGTNAANITSGSSLQTHTQKVTPWHHKNPPLWNGS